MPDPDNYDDEVSLYEQNLFFFSFTFFSFSMDFLFYLIMWQKFSLILIDDKNLIHLFQNVFFFSSLIKKLLEKSEK